MRSKVVRNLLVAVVVSVACFAHAQSFTILTIFNGGFGPQPGMPPLARDAAGNLYGASPTSPNQQNCTNFACGLIYKADPTGKLTVLYTFTGPPDGSSPEAVTLDPRGNLFGTTQYGGAYNQGTVFLLDPAGHETILYDFGGSNGANPVSSLIRDGEGNLYGITQNGGIFNANCFGLGCGTVFEITSSGEHIVLYRFTGGTDGGIPGPNLLKVGDTFYGTTTFGGDLSCVPPGTPVTGCGTVFQLKNGVESVLYSFKGPPDGLGSGYIVRDRTGNIFGTTSIGGDTDSNCALGTSGCGIVYKVTSSGNETILYSFHQAFGADGFNPIGVIMDRAGNLYGTTEGGGGGGFKIDTSGNFKIVHSVSLPSQLIMDAEGNLYGPADGMIFEINP